MTVVRDDLAYTVDLEHIPAVSVIARSPGRFAAPRHTAVKTASGRSCCATLMSFPAKMSNRDDPVMTHSMGELTGVVTTLGFAIAATIHLLD